MTSDDAAEMRRALAERLPSQYLDPDAPTSSQILRGMEERRAARVQALWGEAAQALAELMEPCEFCGRTTIEGPCASCAEPDPNDEVVAAQSLADMLLRRAGEAAIEASRDFRSRLDDNEGDTDGR